MVEVGRARELIFQRTHDGVAHDRGRGAGIADQHLNRGHVGARELLLHERGAADRAGEDHERQKDRDQRRA